MAQKKKTAIQTGGPQGIGAGLMKAFLDRGYNVVANSRNITKSGAFDASDKLALVDGSIAEAATAAKIAEVAKSKFGSIDALVNNAGIYLEGLHDPNVERYDPDLWTDEFAFLNQPGQADIQSDLFYDYRTNVDSYPKWQAWMREKQPRLLVLWGKYDLSFELSEPEAYRRDVPKAEVHVLDAGHFALDTAADQIAQLVRGFMK